MLTTTFSGIVLALEYLTPFWGRMLSHTPKVLIYVPGPEDVTSYKPTETLP